MALSGTHLNTSSSLSRYSDSRSLCKPISTARLLFIDSTTTNFIDRTIITKPLRSFRDLATQHTSCMTETHAYRNLTGWKVIYFEIRYNPVLQWSSLISRCQKNTSSEESQCHCPTCILDIHSISNYLPDFTHQAKRRLKLTSLVPEFPSRTSPSFLQFNQNTTFDIFFNCFTALDFLLCKSKEINTYNYYITYLHPQFRAFFLNIIMKLHFLHLVCCNN